MILITMGYRSRSRSRSPYAERDGHRDRSRRRSAERQDDRRERASPSYRPYRGREYDRGDAPYENGARGAGRDSGSRSGGYSSEHRNGDGAYGRKRPDERLPQSFGRRGAAIEATRLVVACAVARSLCAKLARNLARTRCALAAAAFLDQPVRKSAY